MSITLNHRIVGEGPALLLLHGVFGSLENLGGVSQRLQDRWQIHGLDLRNHGKSPHTDTMDYPSMAEDVIHYMDQQGLDQALILGHSMGGKVAMQAALTYPDRIRGIIVADIAPVTYKPRHDVILEGLKGLDLARVGSRKDADEALQAQVETPEVRSFLLKNLVRIPEDEQDGSGALYRWRLNLPVIEQCYANLAAEPEFTTPYEGPVLFIKGELSAYIQQRHEDAIRTRFPDARMHVIEGTGHWLHAEKADEFAAVCREFLDSL